MAKFVRFRRDAGNYVTVDVEKLVAYEDSGNRSYPAGEYTCLNFGSGVIYVNEPIEEVDKKISTACRPYDPNKRI